VSHRELHAVEIGFGQHPTAWRGKPLQAQIRQRLLRCHEEARPNLLAERVRTIGSVFGHRAPIPDDDTSELLSY
jgi:hypothetical protein